MKRKRPEPPAGPPKVVRNPGLADELWAELAPLLAKDGIREGDTVPLNAFQEALDRAVERYNASLFTPVGAARTAALAVLARTVTALHRGGGEEAADILDAVQPKPSSPDEVSVAGCTGTAAGLLDQWLGGQDTQVPLALAVRTCLPAGHWTGERAADDLLTLARKSRAHSSLLKVVATQGDWHTLHGSALALTGALTAWADLTGQDIGDVIDTALS